MARLGVILFKKSICTKNHEEKTVALVFFSPGPPRCGPILARPGSRKKHIKHNENENENIATAPRPAKEPRSDKRLSRASSNPVLSKRCQESTDGNVEKPLQGETVCKVTFYKVTFSNSLQNVVRILVYCVKRQTKCMYKYSKNAPIQCFFLQKHHMSKLLFTVFIKKIEKVFLSSTQTAQERQSKRSVSPGSEPRRVETSDSGVRF